MKLTGNSSDGWTGELVLSEYRQRASDPWGVLVKVTETFVALPGLVGPAAIQLTAEQARRAAEELISLAQLIERRNAQ